MEYINKNLVFEIVKGVLNLLIEEDKVKSLLPKISNDAPKIYEGFMSNLSDLYKFANNEYKDKIVNVVLDNIALDNLIEVKEVELDKTINDYFKDWKFDEELDIMVKPNNYSAIFDDIKEIARHFFELGARVNNLITAADRGTAEEIIINLKRVEQDYGIDLTKEMEWLRNKVKRGE